MSVGRIKLNLRLIFPTQLLLLYRFLFPWCYFRTASKMRALDTKYNKRRLMLLDKCYYIMHLHHQNVHKTIVEMLKKYSVEDVLEVACGTGCNAPLFLKSGLKYYGLDLSETAIAVASLKYPEAHFINLNFTEDISKIKDNAFDVVYCSSFLEHTDSAKKVIREMVRVAEKHVFILFFEGLLSEPDNFVLSRQYAPYKIYGSIKDIFGEKIFPQCRTKEDKKGWYWIKYSEEFIKEILDKIGYKYHIFSEKNCDFVAKEVIVHIQKG